MDYNSAFKKTQLMSAEKLCNFNVAMKKSKLLNIICTIVPSTVKIEPVSEQKTETWKVNYEGDQDPPYCAIPSHSVSI